MKAAIISLNKRIILKEKNIRVLEAIGFRHWLLSTGKFSQINFVSTKIRVRDPTEDVEYYKDAATTTLAEYDQVFLHNDSENFPGGEIQKHTIKQIKELCCFKGSVYYVYTDPNLHLINLAQVIYNRQVRGTKTEFNTLLRISSNDVQDFANLKWKVIWCGRNFDSYYRNEYQKVRPAVRCQVAASINVDLFKFIFSHRRVELWELKLSERPFDLTYYGNWRQKRKKKLKIYLSNSLTKLVIGFDEKRIELNNTTYMKYAPPELLASLVQESVASIVIGDPAHNNNITTARFYENILFDVCSFIDLDYDPEKRLYKSAFLKDFMYVRTGAELADKIQMIRKDEQLFKSITNQQKQEIL